jgi:hypothetical protein
MLPSWYMNDGLDGADPAVIRVARPVSLGPSKFRDEAQAHTRPNASARLNPPVQPLVRKGIFV